MEYTDDTERNEPKNTMMLGFLTILGIVILFVAVFSEANTSYAHHSNDNNVVVNK